MSYLRKKGNRKQQFAIVTAGIVVAGAAAYFLYKSFQKEPEKKTCCGQTPSGQEIKGFVRDSYSEVVRDFNSGKQASANSLAQAFGYTEEQLSKYGENANMGLACGNPIARASLKFGETVLDLGCGGGFDVMMAADKVGAGGTVWGIDMSQDMINKARENAAKRGLTNVQFRVAEIERLPIEDNMIDCVVSNCVLNLVPNKLAAFQEIYRVMRPGGRLCAADIALRKPLPSEFGEDLQAFMASYVNCLSGAVLLEEYEGMLRAAGFQEVEFVDKRSDLNVWKSMYEGRMDQGAESSCCAPVAAEEESACCGGPAQASQESDDVLSFSTEQREAMKRTLSALDYNDSLGSFYVLARK